MADKAVQKAKNSAAAGRMKNHRAVKFELKGFKTNDPTPTLANARSMAIENRRTMNNVPRLQVQTT
jgi:hypothetical protein